MPTRYRVSEIRSVIGSMTCCSYYCLVPLVQIFFLMLLVTEKKFCKYLLIDVFNVICLNHLINIDFIYKFIYLLNLQLMLLFIN